MIGVIADEEIGLFKNGPKIRHVLFCKCFVGAIEIIVDHQKGNIKVRRTIRADLLKGIFGFNIKNDFSHRRAITEL